MCLDEKRLGDWDIDKKNWQATPEGYCHRSRARIEKDAYW